MLKELTVWSIAKSKHKRRFGLLQTIPTLKAINHKFLFCGRTHLEVDSDHSLIERAAKQGDQFQTITPWGLQCC